MIPDSTLIWFGGGGLLLMLGLMALRVPLGIAMLLVGGLGQAILIGVPPVLATLKGLVWGQLSGGTLAALPLFLLMGFIAAESGLATTLFQAGRLWLGRQRGGLGMAALVGCAGFGTVCGSSVATTATAGRLVLGELRTSGYAPGLAGGIVAAGGTLGALIPPSVILVLYAILTDQAVGDLFAAALVPGLLALGFYLVALAILARRAPSLVPPPLEGPAPPLRDRMWALARCAPILLVLAILIGGLYGGLFTPTEGAAVGLALVLGFGLIARRLSKDGVIRCLLGTAETTAAIFLVLLGAELFNGFLALSRFPTALEAALAPLALSPWLVLGAILVLYLILGALMDELSMLVLTLPVVFPLVMGLDFGLAPAEQALWFGVLVLTVCGIGLLAPPVGLNVFVTHGLMRDVPLRQIYSGAALFVAVDLLRLVLLATVPTLSLLAR